MAKCDRIRSKGRASRGAYLGLPHSMTKSDQWAALTNAEVRLLIDIGSQYKGHNNGDLCASFSVMKERGWRSKTTLTKALKGLIRKGYLELSRQGHLPNLANLYALTWQPVDPCNGKHELPPSDKPSHAWKHG